MAEKSLGGQSKRERARKKQQKAELISKEKKEERKKKAPPREPPKHRLLVTRRVQKRVNGSHTPGIKKDGNCQRHPLKDMIVRARGYREKDYPEANFRVHGGKVMRTAREWVEFSKKAA